MSENAAAYPKTLEELLIQGSEMNASDIHLMSGHSPAIRIQNAIVSLNLPALSSSAIKQLIVPSLSNRQFKSFQENLELDFSYHIPHVARYRGNLIVQKGTLSAVLRVIPHSIPRLDELGLPSFVKNICKNPRGLVLVTGPTGMGKSTTMASMIQYINQNSSKNIITIEDPIEFIHHSDNSLIRQREVGLDTFSFQNALKHALRHDPDVIMIGEMRDLESVSMALTAAETGHLVISSLHTPTAPLSINRIIDMFPSHQRDQVRTQISFSLSAVISQQLLPSKKNDKKILATELLIGTPAVRNLIRECKEQQLYTVMQTNKSFGMQTMDYCLYQLLKQERIHKDTAFEYCIDRSELQRLIDFG